MMRYMILAATLIALICATIFIGCDYSKEDYMLDERDNAYDPENPWGGEVISIGWITRGGTGEYPSWSYDGSKIAYYHPGVEEQRVYVMEGGIHKPLLHTDEKHHWEGRSVKWSPVEDKLAYIYGGLENGILTGDYTESGLINVEKLAAGGYYSSLVWSPHGKKIAYPQMGVIKILEVSNPENIEILDRINIPVEFTAVTDWSPDGRRLLAISTGRPRAYIVDVNADEDGEYGVELLPVAKNWVCMYAVWSKDGSRVMYLTLNLGRKELWIMDVDGSEATAILTEDSILKEEMFLFSVNSGLRDDLDCDCISTELWLAFSDKEIFLSNEATIQSVKKCFEWKIIDPSGSQEYTIRKKNDKLNVYSYLARNAKYINSINWSRRNESDLLFAGSLGFYGREKDVFLAKMNLR